MTQDKHITGIRALPDLSRVWADFMRLHVTERPPEAPVPAGTQAPATRATAPVNGSR